MSDPPPRPRLLPLALREMRGGRARLTFFTACLAVGVAAVVAVAGIGGGIETGLRQQARRLLAADLAVSGTAPLPADLDDLLGKTLAGVGPWRRTDVKELVTLVAADAPGESGGTQSSGAPGPPASPGPPGKSQLVELKVIDGTYPFYGKLELAPDRPLQDLLSRPDGGGAVVAPDLLTHLGLRVGDRIRVGGVAVPITGVVNAEPDRLGGAFGFSAGPRVFLGPRTFDRTGLETTGSRIRYRALIRLPTDAGRPVADRAAQAIRAALPASQGYRVETWAQAQPSLRRGVDRAQRYLGLVALLSLLVGGIGVGQTVRAWLAGRLDAIAVLECLGMRPREVLALYAGQTALLGLVGSLVGTVAGVALELGLPHLASSLLPPELIDPWQPWAMVRGLTLGIGVALLFGLPSLGVALRVPPARVLRRSAEPLPVALWLRVVTACAVVAGVWATATVQSRSAWMGTQFTFGTLAATAALALAARGVVWAVARFRREDRRLAGRFWLRHGLAALGRPGAGTLAAIVALGLGVLVVVGQWRVERRLTSELLHGLPAEAPSVFLIDIQPDQWSGVHRLLEGAGATKIDSVPVVMARLSAIDGRSVETLARRRSEERDRGDEQGGRREGGSSRWALTREQRLTYLETLPEDNKIVAGTLWSKPGVPEVSVEQDFAHDLGVHLGSTLTFDVQGVPLKLEVTSLRTVDWSTFGINFFLVVEPGVLDKAPQFRIAAAHLPTGGEGPFQDRVAASFPNVTVLRVREILDKVVAVIRALAEGVRFVGAFTVLAGTAILAGAVAAGAARRSREVALLKTLGATRAGVVAAYSIEYALVGLVAGVIGAVGGGVLSWAVVVRGMEIPWALDPMPLVVGALGSAALAVVAGLAASARALRVRPVEALRTSG